MENSSTVITRADRRWRWIFGSLSLNFFLLQLFILAVEDGIKAPGSGLQLLFSIGWALLSLLLAGVLGWLMVDRWQSGLGWHWSGQLLTGLAAIIGFVSSANPNHSWFGVAHLSLANYPLAGLELKSLAILLGVVALSLKAGPASDDSEDRVETEQQETRFRLSSTGAAALASAAVVLMLAVAIPSISTGQSVLLGPADQPQRTTVSILPTAGYQLPASYQEVGPALIEAGAIDLEQFKSLFEAANVPLSDEQISILTEGSEETIVIRQSNARFLLNLFWAVGLTNRNPMLLEGQMQQATGGDISRFASTGGWSLGVKPGAELFASQPVIELSDAQQALVEKVAEQLYRPCCNNPTSFPDCNHGMAMLGMLELMAAQGTSEADMWQAAKYVNTYWFNSQMTEVAMLFDAAKGISFSDIPGQEALGPALFSASGFNNLHAFLQSQGLLQGEAGGGASCSV